MLLTSSLLDYSSVISLLANAVSIYWPFSVWWRTQWARCTSRL